MTLRMTWRVLKSFMHDMDSPLGTRGLNGARKTSVAGRLMSASKVAD